MCDGNSELLFPNPLLGVFDSVHLANKCIEDHIDFNLINESLKKSDYIIVKSELNEYIKDETPEYTEQEIEYNPSLY